MGDGAFRDASAALERAATLEQENEQLRAELAEMAKLRIEVEELAKLRSEVESLRAAARSENEGAYMSRLSEEREELAAAVKSLRERLGVQEAELSRWRVSHKYARTEERIWPLTLLASAIDRLRPKREGK